MCRNGERGLSAVVQFSKILFLSIMTMLSIAVVAETNQLPENPDFKLIKKESGSPIIAIAMYDNDRAAICGDSDGNIYRVNNGGYSKVIDAKLGNIDSIIVGDVFTGDFCFTASGKVFSYKKNKITDISGSLPEKVKRLYRSDGSPKVYAVMEGDDVYTLADDGSLKWKEATTEAAKKILSDISASVETDKGVSNISSRAKNFKGMRNGQIYVSSPNYDRENMTATVDYVSDAVDNQTSAIYRVTIKGCRLNAEDIFIKGYNGFKYTLSCGDAKYDRTAYPITGIVYKSDGKDGATLQNRDISFLWLGPKCINDGDHKLSINEVAYNFSTGKEDSINSLTIALPALEEIPDYSEYEIAIKTEDGVAAINTASNGTCAKPFNILIMDTNGDVLSADDKDYKSPDENPYNHLVFYIADGSVVKTDGVIGCDLDTPKSEYVAIVPADVNKNNWIAEIDGKYVKYGIKGKTCKMLGGKTFYAYAKSDGQHNVFAGLVHMGVLTSHRVDFAITGTTEPVAISYDYGTNHPAGRDFTFSGGESGSNWQGDDQGDYGGYLDYQLISYKNKSYTGVFVYLPEGLNTRNPLVDGEESRPGAKDGTRKNLCSDKLTIGYYFEPRVDAENPFRAVNYHINDTPSYCNKMRKKMLYAILFDQYGRFATYSIQDPNEAEKLWDLRKDGVKSKKDAGINMLWEVGNLYNTPIIMGCPTSDLEYNKKVKYGITDRGLFVPPITSGVNATFLSDISVWIRGKDDRPNNNLGKFKIAGYKFDVCNDKSMLFFNTLEIKDLTNYSSIGLNVSDANMQPLSKELLSASKQKITSLNRIFIHGIGGLVSNWFDTWSVVYCKFNVANNYAESYGAYSKRRPFDYQKEIYYFGNNTNYDFEYFKGFVDNYPPYPGWHTKWYGKKLDYGYTIGDNEYRIIHTPKDVWPIITNEFP